MSQKMYFFVVILLTLFTVMSFSMNYIVGLGYSPSRSWVLNLGAMNGFDDELLVNVFTPASTSQSIVYNMSAHVPILGRNEKNNGFRLGPIFSASNIGKVSTVSSPNTVMSSELTFNLGIYGQYYIGPWRLEMDVSRPIDKSDFSLSFGLWYFFSSQSYHFTDYFVADIEADKALPYFSLIFVEPF